MRRTAKPIFKNTVAGKVMGHIPNGRLVELTKTTAEEFSRQELLHLLNCKDCSKLLDALFQEKEQPESPNLKRQ